MNKRIIAIAIGVCVVVIGLVAGLSIVKSAALKQPRFLREASNLINAGKKAEAIKKLEDIIYSKKGQQKAYEALLMLADIYTNDGNLLKAKELYAGVINEYFAYCNYPDVQKKLNVVNMDIIFSPTQTPDSEIYTVMPGDSLTKIANKYSTTVELIKKANGLRSDILKPGMKLKVQKVSFSIIVDKSQSTLTLRLGDEVVKTYAISSGKNNSTPVGAFKIKDKLINPPWYSPKGVIPPGSPDNILGSRWMGLSTPQPGYGIHGTTQPESIGYQCTEGCVRMVNSDVEELFDIIPLQTEVTIID